MSCVVRIDPATYLHSGFNGGVVVYFVAVVLLGTYVVLTFFIVILLDRFSGDSATQLELENVFDKVASHVVRVLIVCVAVCV